MSAGERFMIKEDAEKERANGRKILKEPDGNQAEMSRGVAEPEKRNRGNDAGANEQDRQRQVRAAEQKRARSLKVNEKNDRERNEQDRFDEQTGNGRGAGLFSE